MDAQKSNQEQISAFLDGELTASATDAVFASLRRNEGAELWNVYHQIGDVIRSDDMGFELSSDFNKTLFARLDAEPTFIARHGSAYSASPAVHVQPSTQANVPRRSRKRFALTGMIAAAIAAFAAWTSVPTLVSKSDRPSPHATQLASADTAMLVDASLSSRSNGHSASAATGEEQMILREPRIDEYLFAHQRFSPSFYSAAQFARSAAFANDKK